MCNPGYFLSFVDDLGTRVKMHKLLRVCSQVVNKLSSHCLFLICCNKVETSCHWLAWYLYCTSWVCRFAPAWWKAIVCMLVILGSYSLRFRIHSSFSIEVCTACFGHLPCRQDVHTIQSTCTVIFIAEPRSIAYRLCCHIWVTSTVYSQL